MQRPDFTFNPPEWSGAPKLIANMWRLTKESRAAYCVMQNHPTRKAEVRCFVDGELRESCAENDVLVLLDQAEAWKAAFAAKGWA
jgi:hypothetical protein